jgi:hypothetical protein
MGIIVLMSFAALLRGPQAVQGETVRAPRRQYKYEGQTVEASIALGERAATFLESLYGHERSAQMLKKVAQRANGSQPRPAVDPVIVSLVETEDSDSNGAHRGACLPYGFWRRFMEDEMGMAYTARKRCSFCGRCGFMCCKSRQEQALLRPCGACATDSLVAARAAH